MPAFVMLTRVQPGGLSSGRSLKRLEADTMAHIRRECPGVEWLQSWALLGPYDYLDVFRAPDVETATKVATLIHIHGQATTETWGAIEWSRFKEMLEGMPAELQRPPA
ncbi:MAG TPA: GYD domain-containing protein [Gemmatimonadales bacterium]|nr:GYD domain-containing protein [Gemmatimonadales bacterium]